MYSKISAFKDNWQPVPPGGEPSGGFRSRWLLSALLPLLAGCKDLWLDPVYNEVTEYVDDTKPEDTLLVAYAGEDILLRFPDNSVTLNGSKSFIPKNSSVSYQWSFVSGPETYTLTDEDKANAALSNLVEGVYVFQLTIKDDKDQESSSRVSILVYTPKPEEPYYPPKPPEEIDYSVVRFGHANCMAMGNSKLHVVVRESHKDWLGGIKIDLAKEYYRHSPGAESITFQFDLITLEQLKNFRVGLLDSTSLNQNEPDKTHMISAKLSDAAALARSGITLNEQDMTVTLDLTKRAIIDGGKVMTDKGEEADPNDASYISNIAVAAGGGFSFDMAARPAGKEGWAFAGIYEQAGFNLNSGTFNYNLGNFIVPNYDYIDPDYPETGYRLVFSRGKKENGAYEELVYDPTGFPEDKSAAGIPVAHLHENYLSVRDATATTLGNNDLRMNFVKEGSRVTINDEAEQKFNFSIANESPATGLSYLKFKVKKYVGFSKEDFLAKIGVGLKLKQLNNSSYYQILAHSNYMNYILCEDAGAYAEFSMPLYFLEGINRGETYYLDSVFFSNSIDGSLSDIEVSDIDVSIVGQAPHTLNIKKVDRTALFTGIGAALDNKNTQTTVTLSGLRAGGKELKAEVELDSKVQGLTWIVYTGYYPDDDEEQPFVPSDKIIIYTMESKDGTFINLPEE
jgi:hypothetical protein